MHLPEERIRVVAATPIEMGERRLLPSVLVNVRQARWPDAGLFRVVRIRPVSVVVEDAEGAKWYEIPNTTAEAISTMRVMALSVAAVGTFILALTFLLRHR